MSMDEMRASFTLGASGYDRARQFRAQRLENNSIKPPIPTAGRPDRLIVHLMPLAVFFGQSASVDLIRAKEQFVNLLPLGSAEGCTYRVNLDGYLTYRGGTVCHGYTQLFRNGIIEAVWIGILQRQDNIEWIPGRSVENYIMTRIADYIDCLRTLDIAPPILIAVTLQNVAGATYRVKPHETEYPIYRQSFELPEILIDNYGARLQYQQSLRPLFDVLWNSAGYDRAESFGH